MRTSIDSTDDAEDETTAASDELDSPSDDPLTATAIVSGPRLPEGERR